MKCSLFTYLCMISLATSLQARVADASRTFYPDIDRCPHVWVDADVLYLRPQEKSIVLTNCETDLFTTTDVTLEPPLKADFAWNVGYRLGFGYLFPHHKWDVAVNWTQFNSHIKQYRTTNGDIGLGMFPIWSLADDILPFDWVATAQMRGKLKLKLIDLDFGRAFSWKEKYFLRFVMGLRGAIIDQNFVIDYGGGIFANGLNLAALGSTFGYDTICMKNDYWGIGPRLGIEPQLNLCGGLRLYAGAYGTFGYGSFSVHQQETYLQTVRSEFNCHPSGFRGILDANAGIMWKLFCGKKHRYALSFAVGWEYHRFFKQIAFKGDKFGLVSNDRDLALNGVAFSVRFDF